MKLRMTAVIDFLTFESHYCTVGKIVSTKKKHFVVNVQNTLKMLSKFNVNGILSGNLQYSCLLCVNSFLTERDAHRHIDIIYHKQNMHKYGYFPLYTEDRIREVRNGFYCEFCNKFFPTASRLSSHVLDNVHLRNKGIFNIRRIGNDVVAIKKVVITKEAWNGIVGNRCLICETKIVDTESHMSSKSHLLKLVRADVEFSINNGLYRMVKKNLFHCLICQEVFGCSEREPIVDHFSLPKHTLTPDQRRTRVDKKKEKKNTNVVQVVEKDEFSESDETDDDFFFEVAQKAQNSKSMQLAENDGLQPVNPIIRKEFLQSYIKEMATCKNESSRHPDIVINKKIIIDEFSLWFIKRSDPVKCYVCDESLKPENVDLHRTTMRHIAHEQSFNVVVFQNQKDNDFVRELFNDNYHCGICNVIRDTLVGMQKHLRSVAHVIKRDRRAWRLQSYVKKLKEEEEGQQSN